MLPTRRSEPVPRRPQVIAVEVRLPKDGTWFAALTTSVRPDGLVLSTFRELAIGTAVILELALPGGPLTIDGVVAQHDGESPGVRVVFEALPKEASERLEAFAPVSMAALATQVA